MRHKPPLRASKSISGLVKKDSEEKKLYRWLSAIVFFSAIVLYANTLTHDYALDDYQVISENRITKQGWQSIPVIFKTTHRFGYNYPSDDLYRPLTKSVFALQWSLSPGNPVIGHFTNVLLYALTAVLLLYTLKIYSGKLLFSFITTLLFIVHPIHTEVVANIKSADEILSLLFGLSSLYYIYHYINSSKTGKALAAVFLFFCALLSKESSITLLAVFPVVAYLFTNASKQKQVFLFAGFLLITLTYLFIRNAVTGYVVAETHSPIDNFLVTAPDFAQRFATAVFILALYIKLFFLPFTLVSDYSAGQLEIIGLADYRFIISIVLLISLVIIAIVLFKKRPWISFGIFFFFITASVSSNIFFTIGTAMSERLMYMPSLGWCMASGYIISELSFVKTTASS